MADAKTRKRRLRQRRRDAGLKAVLVWLTPAGQAAMAALRQPGETLDAVVNRALVTLQQGLTNGTSPAMHPREGAGAALVALLQVMLPEGDLSCAAMPMARWSAMDALNCGAWRRTTAVARAIDWTRYDKLKAQGLTERAIARELDISPQGGASPRCLHPRSL
jgi:hypothetical protein